MCVRQQVHSRVPSISRAREPLSFIFPGPSKRHGSAQLCPQTQPSMQVQDHRVVLSVMWRGVSKMKPGDSETLSRDEAVSFDERSSFEPTISPDLDDAFVAQQQKFDRLNRYYDDVVVELRKLLDHTSDEADQIDT